MVIEAITKPSVSRRDAEAVRGKIAVFHCSNAIDDFSGIDGYEIRDISLPCSSLIREFVVLKAFEAGADAVIVLACPEGDCRYLEGNLRARKRVGRVKRILDEIGLDGRRLNFFNVSPGDSVAVERIITQAVTDLEELGPAYAR